MKVLLIDNYDSFTFNVYQYLQELVEEVVCYRNDQLTLPAAAALQPDLIVLSPGPKAPQAAGICLELIQHFKGKVPILGICLGHQAINEAFGGSTIPAQALVHGKTSAIISLKKGIMQHFDQVTATRYHSLAVDRQQLPSCLEITCETADGEIMGLRHKEFLIEGLQFHPESIMTVDGRRMLQVFIEEVQAATGGKRVAVAAEKNELPVMRDEEAAVVSLEIPQKTTRLTLDLDFESLFAGLYEYYGPEDIFLMDSANGPSSDRQQDLIGLFPQFDLRLQGPHLYFESQDQQLERNFRHNFSELYDAVSGAYLLPKKMRFSDIFARLQQIYGQAQQESSYSHGLAGFFSYEYLHHLEAVPRENIADYSFPDIHLTYYAVIIQLDQQQQVAVIGNLINQQAVQQYEQLLTVLPRLLPQTSEPLATLPTAAQADFHVLVEEEAYLAQVARAKEYIQNGDIFQVQLGTRMESHCQAVKGHIKM